MGRHGLPDPPKINPPKIDPYSLLALELMIYTGARRSDVIRLGRQHMLDGWLSFVPQKGSKGASPVAASIPILPALAAELEAGAAGELLFILTEYGRPFTHAGFGAKMRQWCNEAGLPHCTAHGLRKAAATLAAENGATPHQLMAIFGWTNLAQASLYTRAAERRRLSSDALSLLKPRKGK